MRTVRYDLINPRFGRWSLAQPRLASLGERRRGWLALGFGAALLAVSVWLQPSNLEQGGRQVARIEAAAQPPAPAAAAEQHASATDEAAPLERLEVAGKEPPASALEKRETGQEAQAAERLTDLLRAADAALQVGAWPTLRQAVQEIASLDAAHPRLEHFRGALISEGARLVARADESAERRDWAEAAQLLDGAAALLPDSPMVQQGRERVARARETWEQGREKLFAEAERLLSLADVAIDTFAWDEARERLGETEDLLLGFAAELPLRVRLAQTVRKLERAEEDLRYERQRTADERRYLLERERADGLFASAHSAWHESKDAERACLLYRDAAQLGHVGAQNQIGLCFASGRGVARDAAEAYDWFRRAAEGGNSVGQFNLANVYAEGFGTDRDDERALAWARRSADAGYPKAFCRLGVIYREGRAIASDRAESVKWFQRGAGAGEAWCMALLGEAYEHGWGIVENKELARTWFERAAARGYEPARRKLSELK
jgi:hypothetical protein